MAADDSGPNLLVHSVGFLLLCLVVAGSRVHRQVVEAAMS